MSFAVTVTFKIRATQTQAFMPLMLDNAATSLAQEPGCLRFDVCRDADPTEVFLYEVYTDAAAFQPHLHSAHFKAFDAAVADMVQAKSVKTYAEVHP